MRILAVDDDPIILELLSAILDAEDGPEILTAESAHAALALLDSWDTPQIDCFLLDIQMPVMDGIDLCALLRKMPAHRTTPIVMLTAMTEKSYVDAAFVAGATDYVTKPFDIGDLKRRLRTAAIRNMGMSRQAKFAETGRSAEGSGELLAQIPIFDVDNVIEYFAFENYAQRLPRQALFGAVTLGFHIRRIAEFHKHCDQVTFENVVTDVAEAISDCLRDHAFVMSYAGNGSFVVMIEDGHLPDRATLVSRINLHIQQMELFYGPECPVNLQVCAGDLVRLVGRNAEGVVEAVAQAHASAETIGRSMDERVDTLWYSGIVAE